MDADTIKAVLSGICIAAGGLSVVLALILNGTSKWGEGQQTGISDAKMMACVIAAISFFAAATVVQFVTFTITIP